MNNKLSLPVTNNIEVVKLKGKKIVHISIWKLCPATDQHTSSNTTSSKKKVIINRKKINEKFDSTPQAFTDCAWLKRQIECVASESNYFWKAIPWHCFFLICSCLSASWGTLLIEQNAPQKTLFTEKISPSILIQRCDKSIKKMLLQSTETHQWTQHWWNCFDKIHWGGSC